MRYSLLYRFQGALLGLALGDDLGVYCASQPCPASYSALHSLPPSAPYRWKPGLKQFRADAYGLTATHQAMLWTEALVQQGRWQEPLDANREGWLGVEWAIALLPASLFFHDNRLALRQVLSQTVAAADPASAADVLAVGYAIAQILKERMQPTRLIPRILTFLERHPAPLPNQTQLTQRLEHVHQLVQASAPLDAAIAAFRSGSSSDIVATAMYCFLSTPDDLRLALGRAAQTLAAVQPVCTLTGVLAGAQASLIGIPLEWRLPEAQRLPGIQRSIADLKQLAAQLFSVWSGVYDPGGKLLTEVAIAAPNVIRPR